jgi:hypothetical protein
MRWLEAFSRRATAAAVLAGVAALSPAARADEARFEDSTRLADAALGALRGGFAGDDGGMLRFAVDLSTAVDGHPVASLSISNDANGKISATAQNLGSVLVLSGAGNVQITNQGSTGATLVSTGLLPNGNGVMTMIQNGQSKVVINSVATLDIRLSGIGNPQLHQGAALGALAGAMRFSLHH